MAAMRNERPSWFLSTPLNLTRRWLSVRNGRRGQSASESDVWDSRPELETALGLQDSTSRRGSEM